MSEFTLRPARDGDGPAIVALAQAAADTGAVRVSPHYVVDPLVTMRALQPKAEWVLAETDDGLVVGGGTVDFGPVEIEGETYPGARLSNLMVHSEYRRRGIARALTDWRLDRAGPNAVVLAAIQSGNEGSFANAKHWAKQIYGAMVLPGFRAGGTPPAGFEFREPRDDAEWDQVAAGAAEFERGWNFRIPETATDIRERLARTPIDVPVQSQIIVVEGGVVVGAVELHHSGRVQTMLFEHVPAFIRLANLFARVIPKDHELRPVVASRLWHAPGREDVGRALWAYAGHAAATSGNSLATQLDPRGPLSRIVPVRAWTPEGKLSVAVRAPVTVTEDRLISPV